MFDITVQNHTILEWAPTRTVIQATNILRTYILKIRIALRKLGPRIFVLLKANS